MVRLRHIGWGLPVLCVIIAADVSGIVFMGLLVSVFIGSIVATILFIFRDRFHLPSKWQMPVFLGAWALLFLAGVLFTGAILNLISFPLGALSLALLALLWTSRLGNWNWTAVVFYWIGAPLIIWGVFHIGVDAMTLNSWAMHSHPPQYLPVRPNMNIELAIWALPVLPMLLGLRLSNVFGVRRLIAMGVLLVLLNPLIFIVSRALTLPQSL